MNNIFNFVHRRRKNIELRRKRKDIRFEKELGCISYSMISSTTLANYITKLCLLQKIKLIEFDFDEWHNRITISIRCTKNEYTNFVQTLTQNLNEEIEILNMKW